jgi:hypothetical protein
MERDTAVDRLEEFVTAVREDDLPVPVHEVWVYGDVALGLDPVDRLDIYVTKDILLRGDAPDRSESFEAELGVKGIGRTVRASWADAHPDYVRTNDNGYAAPEKCLAAHLLRDDEPIHLEVCNAGFEDNVTRRLKGAKMREMWSEVLDPRGVCLYADGHTSDEAFEKLRAGEYVFPTLAGALEMLGLADDEAAVAAEAVKAYRAQADGVTVRGDVV